MEHNAAELAKTAWDAGIHHLAGRSTGDEPPGNGNLELVELGIKAVLEKLGAPE